jgi:hypothetical protein
MTNAVFIYCQTLSCLKISFFTFYLTSFRYIQGFIFKVNNHGYWLLETPFEGTVYKTDIEQGEMQIK